jgi:hypothetical protein
MERWLRHLEAVPPTVTQVSRSVVAYELRQMVRELREAHPVTPPRDPSTGLLTL